MLNLVAAKICSLKVLMCFWSMFLVVYFFIIYYKKHKIYWLSTLHTSSTVCHNNYYVKSVFNSLQLFLVANMNFYKLLTSHITAVQTLGSFCSCCC